MKKYSFSFFSENADVSIFVEIQSQLSRKIERLPKCFFVDSNSFCKDLSFRVGVINWFDLLICLGEFDSMKSPFFGTEGFPSSTKQKQMSSFYSIIWR